MKHISLFLIAILITLSSICQKSIYQRVAIPALNLKVAANGKSSSIKWLCYDQPRRSPSSQFTNYKQVHHDGSTRLSFGGEAAITLQEALSRGLIEFEGTYDAIIIVNKTNKELVAVSEKATLLGDVPNDKDDIHEVILKSVSDNSSQGIVTSANSSQSKLWYLRSEVEVLQSEGFLTTNNPTVEQLQAAEREFKKAHNLTSTSQFRDAIEEKALIIQKERALVKYKTEVYKYEEILDKKDPSAEDLKKADNEYRKKYGISNNPEFESKLINQYYDILDEEALIPSKVKVYQYEGWISNANPSKAELKTADQNFLEKKGPGTNLRYAIPDEAASIEKKATILKQEGLLENTNSVSDIRNAEKQFATRFGLTEDEAQKELLNRYFDLETRQYHAKSLVYKYSKSSATDQQYIKLFERELGVPETGDLNKSKATDALAFYYRNLLPFVSKSTATAEDFIVQVKQIKASLGLENSFALDDASIKFFKKLQTSFGSDKGRATYNSALVYDGKIYISEYGRIRSYNLQNAQVETVSEFLPGYTYNQTAVDKIKGDLFIVNNELTPVNKLFERIGNSQPIHFGKGMDITDIQSIIATKKIRSITGKDLDFHGIQITSDKFDFSGAPIITSTNAPYSTSLKDMTLTVNRKATLPKGSGIVGKLKVEIYDISNTMVNTLRTRITTLYTRMRGNRTLDFAVELKAQLKANGIEVDQINSTLNNVDIAIRIYKASPNDPQYCYKN